MCCIFLYRYYIYIYTKRRAQVTILILPLKIFINLFSRNFLVGREFPSSLFTMLILLATIPYITSALSLIWG